VFSPKKQEGLVNFLEEAEKVSPAEEELCAILLQNPHWVGKVKGMLSPQDLKEKHLAKLLSYLFEKEEGREISLREIISHFEKEDTSWITYLSLKKIPYKNKEEAIKGLVLTIIRQRRKERWEKLNKEFSQVLEGEIPWDKEKFAEYQNLAKELKGSSF
jgi:hypothetical protein